jgi:hypothetical protein
MALLTLQSIGKNGAVPSSVAANAGGDTVPANAKFLVVNATGAAVTVTITPTQTTSYGVTLPAKTFSVTGGTQQYISLLDSSYLNGSNVIPLTYSQVTGVNVGCFTV